MVQGLLTIELAVFIDLVLLLSFGLTFLQVGLADLIVATVSNVLTVNILVVAGRRQRLMPVRNKFIAIVYAKVKQLGDVLHLFFSLRLRGLFNECVLNP